MSNDNRVYHASPYRIVYKPAMSSVGMQAKIRFRAGDSLPLHLHPSALGRFQHLFAQP